MASARSYRKSDIIPHRKLKDKTEEMEAMAVEGERAVMEKKRRRRDDFDLLRAMELTRMRRHEK